MFDPKKSLGFHSLLTFRAFEQALKERLAGSGVSPTQFIALVQVVTFGPMPQARLARLLGIAPPSATRLIDRMERDGWVTRQEAPDDHRVKLVAPSPTAIDTLICLSRNAEQVMEKAYQGMDPAEIDQAIATLTRARENLGG